MGAEENTTAAIDSGREHGNRIDLLATLKMLDSVYSDIGQLAVIEGRARHRSDYVSELIPTEVTRQEQEEPEEVAEEGRNLTHGDCLRSMLLGFAISLLSAVALIAGAVFIVLRRESSTVKFV